MKYVSPLLFCLLIGACAMPMSQAPMRQGTLEAPIELIGVLQQDVRVSGEVRISGDLQVPPGRTLIFEPGSRVLVLGNDSTKIDPEVLDKGTEILVRGRLQAEGSVEQPISFRLDEQTPKGEGWAGIELVSGASASLKNVDLIDADTALLLIDAAAELEQVNLLGARYGLLLQGDSQLQYRSGRISGGDAGILCYASSAFHLAQLEITDNQEEGLYIAPDCRFELEGVVLERNDLGLVAAGEAAFYPDVTSRDNRVDFYPLGWPEAGL